MMHLDARARVCSRNEVKKKASQYNYTRLCRYSQIVEQLQLVWDLTDLSHADDDVHNVISVCQFMCLYTNAILL